MKKMIILYMFFFLFEACYDDKGHYNYVYSNIEEINSYSKQNVTTITLGDTVKIFPVIKWINPEADTLAYDYFYVFS